MRISKISIKSLAVFVSVIIFFASVNIANVKSYSLSNSPLDISGDSTSSTTASLPITKATIINTLPSPPVGFNPLNATPEDLHKYGFPKKPTDAIKLKHWQNEMKHCINYVAPEQTALDTTSPTNGLHDSSTSNNWCGYIVNNKYNTGINDITSAESEFTVPQYNGIYCPSYWVGMGGVNSGNIIQAGVWTNANHQLGGNGSHCEFWVEDYPNGTILEGSPYVAASDDVNIEVEDQGSTSDAILINNSRDTFSIVPFSTPHHDNTTADFILEACNDNQDYFGINSFEWNDFGINSNFTQGYELMNYSYSQTKMKYETCSSVFSNNLFNTSSTYP